MNTKKKRFVPKKRLIYRRFLALTLAGTLLLPGLVLIQSQPVEASFIVDMASGVIGKIRYTTTVAEIVVSLLTGSGASVTNTNWLNQLNNAYGVESTLATATGTDGTLGAMYEAGLFSVDDAGHFIDNGLGNAIKGINAYDTLGLDDLFTTTNADLELGAWQVADGAQNIGEAAAAGITLGTLGQAVGAVTMGVSLGVLANKVATYIGDKMASGSYIDNNYIPPVGYKSVFSYRTNAGGSYRSGNVQAFIPVDTVCVAYPNNVTPTTSTIFNIVNPNNVNKIYRYGTLSYASSGIQAYPEPTNQYTINKNGAQSFANICATPVVQNNVVWAYNQNDANTIIQAYLNGQRTISSPYSPDIVGPAGNQKPNNYSDRNNITSWPDLHPSEELQQPNTGITPIPWQDYIDQTQIYNQNTTNNNTTIQQGDTYNNFVTNYVTEVQPAEQVETPDYNPVVPEQPDPVEKPENTTEEDIENESYMTTPGLQDVFPFCIPFDIANLFGSFNTIEREAPKITFPLVSELFGIDEEIVIDLSIFNTVATILRTVELIGFALGLAFVTRYLIGG